MDINIYSLKTIGETQFKALIFWEKASYAHQGYIYLIKNTVETNIVKYYHNLKVYYMYFYYECWKGF